MRFFLFLVVFFLAACPPNGGLKGGPQTQWPKINHWSSGSSGKNDIAIIIAIEDYAFLPPVPGARESANDWETFFRKNKGMEDVFVLTDKNASIEEIHRFVDNAVAETKSDGALWFVFIGHGAANPSGTDGLLIGMDANQSYESIKARSLSRKDLQKRISKGIQKQSLLILDACFSGRATDGNVLVKGAQPVIVTSQATVPSNMTILSAAKGSEIAGPLPNAKRPAFSYLLLGGLRGWADNNEDAKVTSAELIHFTRRQLRVIPGRQQTPTIIGSGDMILSVGVGEKDPGIQSIITGSANPSQAKSAASVSSQSMIVTRGKRTGRQCKSQTQCGKRQGCIRNYCEYPPTKNLKTISLDGLSIRGFSFYGLNWNSSSEDWVKKLGIPNYIWTENSRFHTYYYNVQFGRDLAELGLEVRSGVVSKIFIDIREKFENKQTLREVFKDGYAVFSKYLNRGEVQRGRDKAIAIWRLKDKTSISVLQSKEGKIGFQILNPQFYTTDVDRFFGKEVKSGKANHFALGIELSRQSSLAEVSVVERNGAGEKMGLKVGDIIVKMDDKEIKTPLDVIKFMSAATGAPIILTIIRNGNQLLGKIQPIDESP